MRGAVWEPASAILRRALRTLQNKKGEIRQHSPLMLGPEPPPSECSQMCTPLPPTSADCRLGAMLASGHHPTSSPKLPRMCLGSQTRARALASRGAGRASVPASISSPKRCQRSTVGLRPHHISSPLSKGALRIQNQGMWWYHTKAYLSQIRLTLQES